MSAFHLDDGVGAQVTVQRSGSGRLVGLTVDDSPSTPRQPLVAWLNADEARRVAGALLAAADRAEHRPAPADRP